VEREFERLKNDARSRRCGFVDRIAWSSTPI
jgi:hypothetical protein